MKRKRIKIRRVILLAGIISLGACHTFRAASEAFEALPAKESEALLQAPLEDLLELLKFVGRFFGLPL